MWITLRVKEKNVLFVWNSLDSSKTHFWRLFWMLFYASTSFSWRWISRIKCCKKNSRWIIFKRKIWRDSGNHPRLQNLPEEKHLEDIFSGRHLHANLNNSKIGVHAMVWRAMKYLIPRGTYPSWQFKLVMKINSRGEMRRSCETKNEIKDTLFIDWCA